MSIEGEISQVTCGPCPLRSLGESDFRQGNRDGLTPFQFADTVAEGVARVYEDSVEFSGEEAFDAECGPAANDLYGDSDNAELDFSMANFALSDYLRVSGIRTEVGREHDSAVYGMAKLCVRRKIAGDCNEAKKTDNHDAQLPIKMDLAFGADVAGTVARHGSDDDVAATVERILEAMLDMAEGRRGEGVVGDLERQIAKDPRGFLLNCGDWLRDLKNDD